MFVIHCSGLGRPHVRKDPGFLSGGASGFVAHNEAVCSSPGPLPSGEGVYLSCEGVRNVGESEGGPRCTSEDPLRRREPDKTHRRLGLYHRVTLRCQVVVLPPLGG